MDGAYGYDASSEDVSIVETELESLLAIFIDEVTFTRKHDGSIDEIEVQLHPFTGDDTTKQFVCMTLIIRPSAKYPDEVPFFEIRNPRGLGDEEIVSLLQDMREKADEYVGEPVLYTLIEMARESLTEGNIPRCACVLCLEHFDSDTAFHRTSCYHYFHNHCLAAYISHTLATLEEERILREEEGSAHRGNKSQQEECVVCPVCRKPLDSESSCVTSDLPPESGDNTFVLTEEMKKQQAWMTDVYNRQKAKGGIIDLEAEKNKFLINQDTVSTSVSPVKTDSPVETSKSSPDHAEEGKRKESNHQHVHNSDRGKKRGARGRGRGHQSDRDFDRAELGHGRGRHRGGKRFPNDGKENHSSKSHVERFEARNSSAKEKGEGQNFRRSDNSKIDKTQGSEVQLESSPHDKSSASGRFEDQKSNTKKEDQYMSREHRPRDSGPQGGERPAHGGQRDRRRGRDQRETGDQVTLDDDGQVAKDLQNHQINQKWRQKTFGKEKPVNDKPIKFGVHDDDEDEKARNARKEGFYGHSGKRFDDRHNWGRFEEDEAIDDFKLAFDDSEYDCWEKEIDKYAFERRRVNRKDWDTYKECRKDYDEKLEENLKERVERERSLFEEERRMRNEAEKRRAEANAKAKIEESKAVTSILDQFKKKKSALGMGVSSPQSVPQDTGDASRKDNKEADVGANGGDIQWVRDGHNTGVGRVDEVEKDRRERFNKKWDRDEGRGKSDNYDKKPYKEDRNERTNRPYKENRNDRTDRPYRDDRSERTDRFHKQYDKQDRKGRTQHFNQKSDRQYVSAAVQPRSENKEMDSENNPHGNIRNQSRKTLLNDRNEFVLEGFDTKSSNSQTSISSEGGSEHMRHEHRDRKNERRNQNSKMYNYERVSDDFSDEVSGGGSMHKEILSNTNTTQNGHQKPYVKSKQSTTSKNNSERVLGDNYSELQSTKDRSKETKVFQQSTAAGDSSSQSAVSSTQTRPASSKDAKFKKAKPLDFTKRKGQSGGKKTPSAPPPGL